jgi:hypothetical protein
MIIPGLWLGDVDAALDVSFLTQNNIHIVVNCTPNHPYANDIDSSLTNITFIRVPVYDSLLERDFVLMEQYMRIILPHLTREYLHKKQILIHCHAGKQRSGILVAALLFVLINGSYIPPQTIQLKTIPKSRQILADKVFAFVLSRRPQVFTFGLKINFMKSFKRYFNLD